MLHFSKADHAVITLTLKYKQKLYFLIYYFTVAFLNSPISVQLYLYNLFATSTNLQSGHDEG